MPLDPPEGDAGDEDVEDEHLEGLVAYGGDLRPPTLRQAYREGLFPWYAQGDPILWWSPEPRAVLFPLDDLHVPRRLARVVARSDLEVRWAGDVERVARACADARADGTWIHPEMIDAYAALGRSGDARAVEVWRAGRFVGGIYGVVVGAVFCAESMVHLETDMSKVALVSLVEHLRQRDFELLDAQLMTPHLARFGVRPMPRTEYLTRLAVLRERNVSW